MYPANLMLNRMIEQTLYALKRHFGGTVSVYRLNDAQTDLRTGRKTIDKDVFVIRRAIVLPVTVSREVIQSISQISANKAFVCGGSFDSGLRQFIIDARDLPEQCDFTNDDWLVYDGRRYEIKSLSEFEFHTAWIIVGKELMGRVPEQVFPVAADSLLGLAAGAGLQ